MNLWHAIDISRSLAGVIEMPKGTMLKYELEKNTGALILDRVLRVPVPANYGFIPQTLSADGDPLDVFVYSTYSIEPLTIVGLNVERVIMMTDNGEQDEKIIATLYGENFPWTGAEKRVDATLQYLQSYKKGIKVIDVLDYKAALNVINMARNNYLNKFIAPLKLLGVTNEPNSNT